MVAITKPGIVVNGAAIKIKPNSVKFKEGFGNTKVRPQTTGGGNVDMVPTEDIETKIGMISFTMLATVENIDAKRAWQAQPGANTVQMVQGGFSRTLKLGTIEEDPEMQTGVDGEFEVSFSGTQLV